jgi:hypothetical protein
MQVAVYSPALPPSGPRPGAPQSHSYGGEDQIHQPGATRARTYELQYDGDDEFGGRAPRAHAGAQAGSMHSKPVPRPDDRVERQGRGSSCECSVYTIK